MKTHIPIALILATVSLAVAQQGHPSHTVIAPDSLKWTPSGKGTALAVVAGSPSTEGSPFVIRIKMDDGVRIPPHWHPGDEHLTVLKGTFYMGMGEKADPSAAKEMGVGSYGYMPKEMRHFAWVKGETVVQVHGVGPFKTIWVEPPVQQPTAK